MQLAIRLKSINIPGIRRRDDNSRAVESLEEALTSIPVTYLACHPRFRHIVAQKETSPPHTTHTPPHTHPPDQSSLQRGVPEGGHQPHINLAHSRGFGGCDDLQARHLLSRSASNTQIGRHLTSNLPCTSQIQHGMTVPESKHQLSRNRSSKFLELAKNSCCFITVVVEEWRHTKPAFSLRLARLPASRPFHSIKKRATKKKLVPALRSA